MSDSASGSHSSKRQEDEVLGRAFDLRLTRRLLRFLAPYKLLFAGCVALTVLLAGIQLVIPYLSKVAIDAFMTPPWTVATGVEAPDGAGAVVYGNDSFLIDTRAVDADIVNRWERSGNLSDARYVWVGPRDARLDELADFPGIGEAVGGGVLLSVEDLRELPTDAVNSVRQTDINGILRLVGWFIFLLVTRFVFGVLQVYYLQFTGQRVMYDMRREIFAHILRLPLSFFDRTPVGRLVTRVTNDVAAINEMFTSTLVSLFRDVFLLVGVMVVMFQLEWRLALAVLVLFPVIVVAAWQFRNRVRSAYREVRKKVAQLNAYLQESISGMRIVQVFVQEHRANQQFADINGDKYNADMRQMLTFAVFRPLMSFLSSFAVAVVIWYGGRNVLYGVLTLGALTAFIQYVRMLFEPVIHLSEGYNVLQGAMASSERIFRLLDEPIEDPGEAGRTPAESEGRIEFRDVWFAYHGEDWILKGVSFVVEPGQRVAIVGPTGSGKTTIIRLLLRLYPIQKGTILYDGVPIDELDLSFLRAQMSVVLQDVFLFSGDILDNIRLREQEAISEQQAIAAARYVSAEFIEQLPNGYRAEVKERGVTLSVGERQLLSFARAVAFDPRVLVLDEATASIDSHTESLIQRSLHRIMEGRTSLVIAHRLSTIRESDNILVIHQGCLVEQGTHVALLAAEGLYAALHRLQFEPVSPEIRQPSADVSGHLDSAFPA